MTKYDAFRANRDSYGPSKYNSKSIQMSLILGQRPPKPYKLLMFAHFKEYHRNHKNFKSLYMILGDAVSQLQTFVWILNHISRSNNLVSVHPKSTIRGEMINVNTIFHVVVSAYRFVKIGNSPQLPAEFQKGLLPRLKHTTVK